jgi:hypothetical protein
MATKTTTKKAAPKLTKAVNAKKAAPAKAARAATTSGGKGEAKEKKISAIDAAAKVLAGAKTAMNAKEMIEAMAAKNLWTSPSGKTPHQTLYAAIIRELSTKGNDARFKKTERGKFTANG